MKQNKNIENPREGWYEAIIAEGVDEEQLLPNFSNEFDKSEWQWKDDK